jgi:hypothetical protein
MKWSRYLYLGAMFLVAGLSFAANGMWLDLANSETGFSAAFTTHLNLATDTTAVPFLAGGVGFYHASLDRSDDAAPAFYANRFKTDGERLDRKQTFTDPAFTVGGGVDIVVSPQLALRPQGDVMFVVGGGDTRVLPVFTLHLTYHFHDHPMTPSRR